MTWYFFEAGHGKGPADGIGGYLKRSADDMVARGPDISNADNFYECLKDVKGPRPSCTKQSEDNIENHGVKAGDFLLVNVKSNSRKIYKYVCVVNELQDDGDITDTILRSVKHKNTFTMVHHDVSVIDYRDIVEILSKPTQIIKRGQIYYNFNRVIDINEK
ncbi:hypothetical protein ACJJTC_019771 [Scirpophaga incertulas]